MAKNLSKDYSDGIHADLQDRMQGWILAKTIIWGREIRLDNIWSLLTPLTKERLRSFNLQLCKRLPHKNWGHDIFYIQENKIFSCLNL